MTTFPSLSIGALLHYEIFILNLKLAINRDKALSESEAEDDPKNHVVLPQDLASRGAVAAAKTAIRMSELGPRLTLQVGLIHVTRSLLL